MVVEAASADVVGVAVAVAEEGCKLVDWSRISHMPLRSPDHTVDEPVCLQHLCHTHALPFPTSKPQVAC